jgi:integrase
MTPNTGTHLPVRYPFGTHLVPIRGQHMAIERRLGADGKPQYRVRISDKDVITGKRKNLTVGSYSTKREAEKSEREALTKRDKGTLVDPSTITVGELLQAWLQEKRHDVTGNTYTSYRITIEKHLIPAIGGLKLQSLRANVIQAQYTMWRDSAKPLSPQTIRLCHMRLVQALDMAVRLNMIPVNMVRGTVKAPGKQNKKPDVWSPEEAAAFLVVAKDDWHHPLWHILLLEGMRRGEALGLRWSDLDLDKGTAHLSQTVVPDFSNKGLALIQSRTKTAAGSRQVRLTPETITALKEHRKVWLARKLAASEWANHDLIVCTRDGKPINPNNVGRSFDRMTKKAELPRITVHSLRHTSATLLLRAGIPAKVVAERLGHKNVNLTLDRYSHVTGDMQETAANAFTGILTISR